MRYSEIVEAARADRAAKAAENRKDARERLAAANKKRADEHYLFKADLLTRNGQPDLLIVHSASESRGLKRSNKAAHMIAAT